MKKVLLFLAVASMAFAVGMVLMAPEPGQARAGQVAVTVPAVPALGSRAVTLETGAVLRIVPEAKEAPKPRPVARKPKARTSAKADVPTDCGNAKYREAQTTAYGTGVVYCHN